MDENENTPNPISFIADFDGDITSLFNKSIDEILPILPLRNMVIFPGVMAPVVVARDSSNKLINAVQRRNSLFVVGFQRNPQDDEPRPEELYPVGVVAKVVRLLQLPNGATSAILQTFGRVRIGKVSRLKPYLRAHVESLAEEVPDKEDKEYKALAETCTDLTTRMLRMDDSSHEEIVFAIRNIHHPMLLVNFICTNFPFPIDEKVDLLEFDSPKKRAYKLVSILQREYQFATLKRTIQIRTKEELDQQQKEYFLQQQIKNIQSELGENGSNDVQELRDKAEGLQMPEKVRALFEKELKKLERINTQAPDYNTEYNYLQTLVGLPWGRQSTDNLDIPHAAKTLDRDHYGMEKVKERILEHLAVLRLSKETKAPILCLYGPPGVGKTSLGRSIAKALGRKYVRISLGGIHDESEIRGHRRTYIGAMPGRIIKGIQKAETDNPVFILDEIDKVSSNNYNGDPQSALLEVLDPEQNTAFHDNYLDVDYDLSKVLFIATANTLSTIPGPLLDRMELIEVEGYLPEEKKEIARRHLIPRALDKLNFPTGRKPKFAPTAIDLIIEKYTRESGVRQLEKQIDKVFRKMAYQEAVNEEDAGGKSIKAADIARLLGKPIYNRDRYQGNRYAGVVTGLAWTAVGGEILFIETGISRSKAPKLTITGNLGDVMKESAVLALEYVKAHAEALGIDHHVFEHWSIHIHVPEGATPKDGPSAGITIATSIASALTQRKVRANTAMTGEITLRGKVLPVGGIKEKILAAKRAGITTILMSTDNRKDIEEIKPSYIDGLTFHFVENVNEVFRIALLAEKVEHAIYLTIEEDDKPTATAAEHE